MDFHWHLPQQRLTPEIQNALLLNEKDLLLPGHSFLSYN